MNLLLLVCMAAGFFATAIATAWWIRRARKAGLVGQDMNKPGKRMVPEMGGLAVTFGFIVGLSLYIGHRTFFQHSIGMDLQILAVVGCVAIMAVIGVVDDILGWKIGLRQWQKPFLCMLPALPIMMINAGVTSMSLPLVGTVNLGLLYPLLVVPFLISASANGFNMLAGMNGLEAGMGVIMLSTLGFIAWKVQGAPYVAMVAAIMVCCLVAFLIFNWYPARVFPGNTLTFVVGAVMAVVAILANTEKALIVLFIPYMFEFVLKARGRFQRECFLRPTDGSLRMLDEKVYSLTHAAAWVLQKMFKRVYEWQVVVSLYIVELIVAGLILLAFV
jgi:UDP-N-acetylglucosamine--dolichyl-phosphate N-acetylglucosaminephosphotransferase